MRDKLLLAKALRNATILANHKGVVYFVGESQDNYVWGSIMYYTTQPEEERCKLLYTIFPDSQINTVVE